MYRIAVTNRHLCNGDFLKRIEEIAKDDYYTKIILREKDLNEQEYEQLAIKVLKICEEYNKICILHNFYNVAVRLNNPYIHLPLTRLIKLRSENIEYKFKEIGVSTHSIEQINMAVENKADYVTFGHVFKTNCKKDLEPRGLKALEDICKKAIIPVYAIGGINEENEQSTIKAGAKGVCIMSKSMIMTNI